MLSCRDWVAYKRAAKNWDVVRAGFIESEKLFSKGASTFFDLMRIVAAIVVVMEHLASRLFIGYGDLEAPGRWAQLLYWLNLLGSPAVVVFFVLSGLFISRSIYRSALLNGNGFDWTRYLTARLTRLWLVLIPALLVTFFFDQIAEAHGWINNKAGVDVLIGNVLFVQTILVPQFGSNGPLWSISNEFWYYMIFPLVVLAAMARPLWRRLVFLGIATALLVFIGPTKAAYFLMWLLGACVMLLPMRQRQGMWCSLAFACVILVGSSLVRPLVARGRLVFEGMEINLFWPDLVVAISAFFLMRIAFVAFEGRAHFIGEFADRMIRGGAAFSFSLYVIHYPVINAGYFLAHSYGFNGFQPGLLGVAFEVGIVVILCAIAWLFSRLTERHTGAVRIAIDKSLLRMASRGV